MDILGSGSNVSSIKKAEVEQVQQQKQEFYLLGTYLRTRGLMIFSYNPASDTLERVEIKYGDTIHLVPMNGKLIPVDYENEKCIADSRFIYFEALNWRAAEKRLIKYKDGTIMELGNLRVPSKEGIKLW